MVILSKREFVYIIKESLVILSKREFGYIIKESLVILSKREFGYIIKESLVIISKREFGYIIKESLVILSKRVWLYYQRESLVILSKRVWLYYQRDTFVILSKKEFDLFVVFGFKFECMSSQYFNPFQRYHILNGCELNHSCWHNNYSIWKFAHTTDWHALCGCSVTAVPHLLFPSLYPSIAVRLIPSVGAYIDTLCSRRHTIHCWPFFLSIGFRN